MTAMRLLPRLLVLLLVLLCVPLLTAPGVQADEGQADEGPLPIGRVAVRDDGFVRVTAERLEALGALSTDAVEVRRRGRLVPQTVATPAGDLVFLAADHATNHSAWGVYELWLVPGGRRTVAAAAWRSSDLPPPPFARRVHDPDYVHGALAAGRAEVYDHPHAPTWFLAYVDPGKSVSTDLDPLGADPGSAQSLEVEVWATRIGEVTLHARWGEHDLGLSSHPSAAGGAVFRWLVPADALPPEGTALVLSDRSPPPPAPPAQDVSSERGRLWIESLALRGPVEPVVDAGLRVFDVRAGQTLLLASDGPFHLAARGEDGAALPPPAAVEVEGAQGESPPGGTPVPCAQAGRVFASTQAVTIDPAPMVSVDPLAAAGDARHVILAVPALLEPAKRLARHRSAEGLPSAVVPVQDVYSAYGFGEAHPGAIRDFVVALQQRKGAPLGYVLLAGDASLDRTDMLPESTIPAPMARTIYNGATPADRLYAGPPDGGATGGASIGRLPFRDARTMDAFVDRLIAYETSPPVDPSRRRLRFVTNEARFGAFIDRLIETMFRSILTTNIPAGYDIEVTFASPTSPYLWPPPEFDDKVIEGFNAGCLFYTYVGHGFAHGFDSLHVGDRRFPVLHVDGADRVRCEKTPPVVFVVACTTATFDDPRSLGIGETLMANPAGPIAYWGATRICHPAANTLLGRSIARHMSREEGRWRLGDILAHARDEVLDPTGDSGRALIDMALRALARGAPPERLALEGTWMYTLLGDPATRIAVPASDLGVEAVFDGERTLEITAQIPLADGTEVHLSVEVQRNRRAHEPVPVENPLDEASYDRIRANHDTVNDLALARHVARVEQGRVAWSWPLPDDVTAPRLVVKAWAIGKGDVHQGAQLIDVPDR